jgi:peptide/nickel transport system substrate-binding protein
VGLRKAGAAALGVLVVFACAATSSGASSTSTTLAGQGGVKILDGGTVTVAVWKLPTNYNPSTPDGSNAVTQMAMEQVWPQAFVVGPGVSVRPDAGLVVSAELTGLKPQTVVYALAKRARWSDGVPITAADFIYDWRNFLTVGPSLPATFPLAGYRDIATITGSDAGKTVTVVFTHPYADWMALFSNLVPAHIARRYGWEEAFRGADPAHLVSGGPFEITKIDPGHELVLSRNPAWWGKPAHLARIVFRVMSSAGATRRALRDGTVDLAEFSPGPAVTNLVAESRDLVATQSLTGTLWQLAFNFADPVTSQADVREAIAKAIDRTQLVADTVGLFANDAATTGNRLYAKLELGGLRNDSAYTAPNTAEADQLLATAGYLFDTDGLAVTASGAPLELQLTGPKGNRMIATVEAEIQAELLQAGVELQIHNVALSQLLSSILPQGRYQFAIVPYLVSPFPSTMADLYTDPVGPTPSPVGGSSPTNPPTAAGAQTLLAGTETEPSAANARAVTRDVFGYDNPTVDGLFALAQSQLNAQANAGLYNQIDTLLWQDLPTLPLFQAPSVLVRQVKIVNVSDSATWAGPMWDAEDWAIQVSPTPTTSTTTPGS